MSNENAIAQWIAQRALEGTQSEQRKTRLTSMGKELVDALEKKDTEAIARLIESQVKVAIAEVMKDGK